MVKGTGWLPLKIRLPLKIVSWIRNSVYTRQLVYIYTFLLFKIILASCQTMMRRSLGMTFNQKQMKENRNYLHQASTRSRMTKILFLMNNYIFIFLPEYSFFKKKGFKMFILKTFDNGRRERNRRSGGRGSIG